MYGINYIIQTQNVPAYVFGDLLEVLSPFGHKLVVLSLNKSENWFAALANIAILKTKLLLTLSISSRVKI